MSKPLTPPQTDSAITHRGSPRYQAGLTLVEIMISLTLGLVVLLAVGSIYIGSRQTYRVQEDNARIQEAGKYALEVIGRSVRQAGADAEMTFNPVAITLNCVAPTCTPIVGTNGVAAAADSLTVQLYAGRDELIGGAWFTRDCTGGQVASGTLMTNLFDINGTDLRCTGSVGGVQALVSDVEDLQVLYGIDNDPPGTAGYQSADQYVAAPTAAQWPQVVTARVCVQVRSANNGLATTPQTYLNCAGALGTTPGATTTAGAGDLRLHRTFVATYNLRNRVNGAP
jgi:type IV pilus assembly protein PilW